MLGKVKKLKNTLFENLSPLRFALIMSFLNLVLFHYPFFKFVCQHADYNDLNGTLIIVSLAILIFVANALVFYILCYLSKYVGKAILVIFFILSSIALYFIITYNVQIDESMMGNVVNTNKDETLSFFSYRLILYVLVFGVLPSIYIFKAKLIAIKRKKFFTTFGLILLSMFIVLGINAGNWVWVRRYSEPLGSLLLPWSYTVNTSRFYIHKQKQNRKETLLPDAKIKDDDKSLIVLVIGESARRKNFSLYGYPKNTNPLLSQTKGIHIFNANSAATYTIAGVKAILEHKSTSRLYECLPNYLSRTGVDVIWRTNNTGEPPTLNVKKFLKADSLSKMCVGENCGYDEVLLAGLKKQILESKKNKILVVLHTSTSHGPAYSKKYPPRFEFFRPVCTKVELNKCAKDELYNAYDNTIVYTDYILHSVIDTLKEIKDYKSTMIFISDHGESLGENNLYMHGVDMSFAPKEQYEIPFIVWLSDNNDRRLKRLGTLSQGYIFHSIMNYLSIESPIYNEELNIFR